MRVVVTGATGTIGAAVCEALTRRGDEVVALSRAPSLAAETLQGAAARTLAWGHPTGTEPPREALAGSDAVVHLLGEPISQRWSARAKREIRDSRVLSTRNLAQALRRLPDNERPRTLVSQSATGFYGARGSQPVDEADGPGEDWLARVVVAWETEALAAGDLLRVSTTRTGVVLSPRGGALQKMLPFFRLGIGGPVAGGQQYMSWVHLDDVVGAMLRCLEDAHAEGAINVTAPNPVTNAEFSRSLGRVLHRPAVLPVPGFALRVRYGEMATILTTGQAVKPARLELLGHEFRWPELESALAAVLQQGG
jgi:uncharacterized protein (TIGR01777 family)